MVLAHVVGDKTEVAYLRTDVLDKRRTLMAAWSAFLAGDNQCLNRAAAFGGT